MDLLQIVTNAIVVGAVGVVLGFMVHGLRSEVRGVRSEAKSDTETLRSELRADLGAFRSEVRADLAEIRREIGELRSDLTQVALAVGARPKASRS